LPASNGTATRWTCDNCEVTASWAADAEKPAFPQGWTVEGKKTLCLGCRRELAGDAGADAMPAETAPEERQKAKAHARIEFEVMRDPDRRDNAIAKACRTSVVAVRKARERLGVGPGGEL
jgi:hypothetical protein